MFEFFNLGSRAYARRAETMLREARFAQLEHEAAAEHHAALARMYAERILRLEGTFLVRSTLRSDPASVLPEQQQQPPSATEQKLPAPERTPLRVLSPAPSPGHRAAVG